ncbi:MAG: transketolase [Ruminococcaceae bacterium]|nr:transketolase [Oscillospiraceae bacterium]
MEKSELKELKLFAANLRKNILTAVYSGKSGHPGGSLSIADTLTYLYNKVMNIDPKNPKALNRDRLVLSKGHTSPALYGILAELGYFPKEELTKFRHIGCMLQGHPDMKGVPGVDMSTGSLGQGLSAACGMAISAKVTGSDYKVYAILGDGEIQEGQIWEAAMFAAAKNLDNLAAIVDNNDLQIDGRLRDVNSPYPINEKFEAFGWHVIDAVAHDFNSLASAFAEVEQNRGKGKPIVIVQCSVKGKCVSYMEDRAEWHGNAPNKEQYEQGISELDQLIKEIEEE